MTVINKRSLLSASFPVSSFPSSIFPPFFFCSFIGSRSKFLSFSRWLRLYLPTIRTSRFRSFRRRFVRMATSRKYLPTSRQSSSITTCASRRLICLMRRGFAGSRISGLLTLSGTNISKGCSRRVSAGKSRKHYFKINSNKPSPVSLSPIRSPPSSTLLPLLLPALRCHRRPLERLLKKLHSRLPL